MPPEASRSLVVKLLTWTGAFQTLHAAFIELVNAERRLVRLSSVSGVVGGRLRADFS